MVTWIFVTRTNWLLRALRRELRFFEVPFHAEETQAGVQCHPVHVQPDTPPYLFLFLFQVLLPNFSLAQAPALLPALAGSRVSGILSTKVVPHQFPRLLTYLSDKKTER